MSIAILSAKTGNGHVAVMNTIAEEFKRQNYNDVSTFPSFYEDIFFSNKVLSDFYNFLLSSSSIELCSKFSEISSMGRYDLCDDLFKGSREKILEFVKTDNLEAIISTSHSVNNNIIRVLKETDLYGKIPLYIVVTDPFSPISVGFNICGATKYFCATETVRKILEEGGVESRLIEVIGYPVSKRFTRRYSDEEKSALYESIGLVKGKKTILVNSGALGSLHFYNILRTLGEHSGDYQIIFICGANNTLVSMASSFVRKLNSLTIKVMGFIDNMEEILQISDVAITKPGANTFFECLYSEVPPIIDGTQGFLYQERGVLDFLEENQVGIVLKENKQLLELIDSLLSSDLIDKLKGNIKMMNLINGSSEIVKSVLENLHN